MANDVNHLIDVLYGMIDEAKNAPLSADKCVINRDEALDILEEVRAQLPLELKRAQELLPPAMNSWNPPSAMWNA